MPSFSEEDPIITTLTGKNVEFVQSHLGLPHQRKDAESGAMVWVYLDNEKGNSAKDCSVTLSIRNNKVENVYLQRANRSLMGYVSEGCERIRKDVTG